MTEIEEIIIGCKKNDPKAMGKLYEKFSPKLFGVCMRYSQNRCEAEDVLHESFIKIFKSFQSFKGNDKSLGAWLKRIAVYTAIDNFKSSKRRNFLSLSDNYEEVIADNEDVTDVAQELSSEDLFKIIDKLPEGYRVIFNLYVVEGFTHKEIAEILNISEGTSKSQLFKAKSQIKKIISQYKLSDDGIAT